MPEQKPLSCPDVRRVFQFSVSTMDPDGTRKEYSVRVASPAVVALAAIFLMRAFISPAAEFLARAVAPPPAALATLSPLAPSPWVAAPAGPLDAPGTVYGQTADVITPLDVRDPAALVMAPAGH